MSDPFSLHSKGKNMKVALWIVGVLVGLSALLNVVDKSDQGKSLSQIQSMSEREFAQMQTSAIGGVLLMVVLGLGITGVLLWASVRIREMRGRLGCAAALTFIGSVIMCVVAGAVAVMTQDQVLRQGYDYNPSPAGEGIGLLIGLALQSFIAWSAISAAMRERLKTAD